MIKLTIPGPPCAKQRPRLGKYGTYTPDKTVNYETLVKQLYIIEHHAKQLEGQLQMTVRAYFEIPKSKSQKQARNMSIGAERPTKKPDWDNIGKIVSDALNGLAYHDDSQIVTATVEKWYSDNPRVEVEIQEIGARGMMDKLLPCPFCGCEAFIYLSGSNGKGIFAEVHCKECHASTDRIKIGVNEMDADTNIAIEAWNRRAT